MLAKEVERQQGLAVETALEDPEGKLVSVLTSYRFVKQTCTFLIEPFFKLKTTAF